MRAQIQLDCLGHLNGGNPQINLKQQCLSPVMLLNQRLCISAICSQKTGLCVVQTGVPHDAAGESSGWAWAGSGGEDDAIAANRLSQFVASTLRTQV